ncbi:MAG: hypothetical protein ACJAT7_002013, partial [Psychromonas sp.]|uniref:DUF711 family protein n=1 Tax=Psychromonas sp. TaxID=1884585 RepID=UPI0039E40C2A
MNYQSTALCKLRTITTFLVLDKNRASWQKEIQKASDFCLSLAAKFSKNGYQVQSIRIVTNAFAEYLNTQDIVTAKADLHYISELLTVIKSDGLRIRFAIGEAKTAHQISLLPELIEAYGDLCNACVNVPLDENGILDNQLIEDAARAVAKISTITPRGEGNFNFTVNFNCQPLIPYFPASYHQKALGDLFVIGLETPDLLVHVLNEFNNKNEQLSHNDAFKSYERLMSEALQYHVDKVNKILTDFEKNSNSDFTFAG